VGHPKDDEAWLVGTVVRIKKTGEFAIVASKAFLTDNTRNFLHYEGPIDGRGEGHYVFYHDDVELESLPFSQLST
jgi:hypothetical protein